MNWGNYIKRTAVRRVVWIVVGAALYGLLSIFPARAAQFDSQPEAYAACVVDAQLCSDQSGSEWSCRLQFSTQYGIGPPGAFGSCGAAQYSGGYLFPPNTSCSTRPDVTERPPFLPAGLAWRNGAIQCDRGCMVGFVGERDMGWLGVATGQMCTGKGIPEGGCEGVSVGGVQYVNSSWGCIPPPSDCQPHETRDPVTGQCGLGCPAGQILTGHGECVPEKAVCPAGQTKAPDGSCLPSEEACPNGQVRGADGSCKRDSDGDGEPDEGENDGTFSGGESCLVPPQCSGDNIMCGQARIQWRIDCNTRRAQNISGGTCEAMPICVGEHCDPMEYAQLIQQWRTSCALAKLNQGVVTGDGEGDDGGTAEIDVGAISEGAVDGASGTIGDGGDPGEAFSDGSEGGQGDGELDTAGLGFGTACPALPSINVLGVTLDFNEIGPALCDWMSLGGYIVLILSSLLSLRILAGGMNV